MKSKFFFNPKYQQMQHSEYPSIYLDKKDFDEMTDDEIENLVNQKILEINHEVDSLSHKKPQEKYLTHQQILNGMKELKDKLSNESFKIFFFREKTNSSNL